VPDVLLELGWEGWEEGEGGEWLVYRDSRGHFRFGVEMMLK
jgi:hypothetical protein